MVFIFIHFKQLYGITSNGLLWFFFSFEKIIYDRFLLGFAFPPLWYYATVLYFGNYYLKDPRERPGLAASAIAVSKKYKTKYLMSFSFGHKCYVCCEFIYVTVATYIYVLRLFLLTFLFFSFSFFLYWLT